MDRFKRPIGFPKAYRYDLAAGLLVGIFEGLTAPFLGVLALKLGASVWQVALLTSIPFYGHTLALFWASRRIHFTSPLAYVTFATAVTRILFLGMAWVNGPNAFVACACLAQFLAPIHGPAYTEVMREIYSEQIRGKAMGSVRMAGSVATMLAASVGGNLLDLVGFRVIFPIAALLGVAASWVLSQIPYPSPTALSSESLPLREIFETNPLALYRWLKQNPTLRRFETGFFLFGFGNLMIVPLVPILLVNKFQVSNLFVGELAFVTALARLVSLYFWGLRIDRRGALGVTGEILLVMVFVPLSFAVATRPLLLILPAALSGCAMAGLELAVIGSMITLAKKGDTATTMAFHQTLLGVRGIIAPLVGTLALHWLGLPLIFLISSFLILMGALFVRRLVL